MKNPLTFRLESGMGALIISIFAIAFIAFLFIEMSKYNSDLDVLTLGSTRINAVSPQEKELIDQWIASSGNDISVKDVGYLYILRQYPDKPWFNR